VEGVGHCVIEMPGASVAEQINLRIVTLQAMSEPGTSQIHARSITV
jgi:hypothetical protein